MSRAIAENVTAMSNLKTTPQTSQITLSPLEGQRLFDYLDALLESGDPKPDCSAIDELLDKVGDANALALWLREYVNVELEGQQITKLREVLESMSSKQSVASPRDTVLPGIQCKLASCLPSGQCAAKMH
jgi:hypothetical protein